MLSAKGGGAVADTPPSYTTKLNMNSLYGRDKFYRLFKSFHIHIPSEEANPFGYCRFLGARYRYVIAIPFSSQLQVSRGAVGVSTGRKKLVAPMHWKSGYL